LIAFGPTLQGSGLARFRELTPLRFRAMAYRRGGGDDGPSSTEIFRVAATNCSTIH
jgi:hypothetical protein